MVFIESLIDINCHKVNETTYVWFLCASIIHSDVVYLIAAFSISGVIDGPAGPSILAGCLWQLRSRHTHDRLSKDEKDLNYARHFTLV